MRLLTIRIRRTGKQGFPALLLAAALTLVATPAFCGGPNPETIQATVFESGRAINITLVIESLSSPADLQILSQAYQTGQDRGLVDALAKIKPVGRCSIAGAPGYAVAFIQVVATQAGRQITFIANRPLQPGEDNANTPDHSFDLAIGEFDLNDADTTKSTGFLYPASKLAIDEQGEFHYDLAGAPWWLVDVLDARKPAGGDMALAPAQ